MGRGRRVTQSAAERFWLKVDKQPGNGCWTWTAARLRPGPKGTNLPYGRFSVDGQARYAHIWAWEQEHGPVPPGKQLDHVVCDNPPCVRPDHLRVSTPGENSLRGAGPAADNNRKQVCKDGHPLSSSNVRINANGARICLTCHPRKGPKTHCKRGHPLSGDNVRVNGSGARICRACEHARRGVVPAPYGAAKTHCKRGHPLSGENVYVDPRGMRQCRTCLRAAQQRWRERQQAG